VEHRSERGHQEPHLPRLHQSRGPPRRFGALRDRHRQECLGQARPPAAPGLPNRRPRGHRKLLRPSRRTDPMDAAPGSRLRRHPEAVAAREARGDRNHKGGLDHDLPSRVSPQRTGALRHPGAADHREEVVPYLQRVLHRHSRVSVYHFSPLVSSVFANLSDSRGYRFVCNVFSLIYVTVEIPPQHVRINKSIKIHPCVFPKWRLLVIIELIVTSSIKTDLAVLY
jgi:hypothetical protein